MYEADNNRTTDRNDKELQIVLQELFDMRSDERECQNQILQVLSVAATFIGILFGGGYIFGGAKRSLNESLIYDPTSLTGFKQQLATYVTGSRIIFLLNSIVFCISISYVLKLAISNVIRYYHIQDLQNRAIEIRKGINEEPGRELIFWDEYRMTIMTMNPKHVNSIYAAAHFATYSISMFFILLLCLLISYIQYSLISNKQWYDHIGLMIVILTALFCMFVCLYTFRDSKVIGEWIRTKTIERRLNGAIHESEIFHNIKYFVYPRLSDLQKPVLIILGAVIAYVLGKCKLNWNMAVMLHRLFWTVFIFDFLAYQARFILNDIRGFKEDSHSSQSKRLIVNENNQNKYIWAAIFIVFFRIAIAIFLLFVLHVKLRPSFPVGKFTFTALEIELLILLTITFLYEASRSAKITILIYILVGLGYPLRIAVGFMSAYPDVNPTQVFPFNGIAFFLIGIYLWGTFSSMIAWVQDLLTIKSQYENTKKDPNNLRLFNKHYYYDLENRINKSYYNSKRPDIMEARKGFFPLREQGSLSHIWNLTFVGCYISFSIATLIVLETSYKPLFLGIELIELIDLVFVIMIFKDHMIRYGIYASCLLSFLKILLFLLTSHPYRGAIIIIILVQLSATVTYYILRYNPEMQTIQELALSVIKCIMRILFSRRIVNQLFDNSDK